MPSVLKRISEMLKDHTDLDFVFVHERGWRILLSHEVINCTGAGKPEIRSGAFSHRNYYYGQHEPMPMHVAVSILCQ